MDAIYLFLGLVTGTAAAWWGIRHVEQSRFSSRMRELEAKYRYAAGESTKLHNELVATRKENTLLQKDLESERSLKAATAFQWAQSLKKGVTVMGLICFTGGLTFGGGIAWVTAQMQTEARFAMDKASLVADVKIARDRSAYFEERTYDLNKQVWELQTAYNEVQVETAVARTKLQILLDSLSPQRGAHGFQIDYPRLQGNLKEQLESQLLRELAYIKSSTLKT